MKKKVIYVVATLVVVVAVTFNVKTVLESNHDYDLTMASIDALSESGGQESNNEDSGMFFYTHLKGKPRDCTYYKHISATGVEISSTSGTSLGADWMILKIAGWEESCPTFGEGCTPLACHISN